MALCRLASFIVLTSVLIGGNYRDFRFERSITLPRSAWNTIHLPSQVQALCRPSLADLRILALSTKGDSIEIPYIIRYARGGTKGIERSLEIVNAGHEANAQSFMLENPGAKRLNMIELEYPETNFDCLVRVEGSDDRKQWLSVIDSQRIVAVSDEHESYSYTTIHLPPCTFKWLRVRLNDATMDLPKSVRCFDYSMDSAQTEPITPGSWKSELSTKDRMTHVILDFPQAMQLSAIALDISESFEYSRPVSIYTIGDSVHTSHGSYCPRTLQYTGMLRSDLERRLVFSAASSAHWLIEIEHGDNMPIHVAGLHAECERVSLAARFPTEGISEVWLVYSNPNASVPSYDIASFENIVPKDSPELSLGSERARSASITKSLPLLSNPLWMWSAIGLIVLLVGGATLRMMRQTASSTNEGNSKSNDDSV